MKKIFAAAVLFASVSAQATEFKPASVLPTELKQKIASRVLSGCPNVTNVTEVETYVSVDSIDQGVQDLHFTTLLSGSYSFDGRHTTEVRITVASSQWDLSNPSINKHEVRSLDSDARSICK